MDIEYIGHAGFIINYNGITLIIDPWLSKEGAFDKSWFQFPCNHHLFTPVKNKIAENKNNTYLYISHEHKDHFDTVFLKYIQPLQPKIIIPAYHSKNFLHDIEALGFKKIIELDDDKKYNIPTKNNNALSIKLFIDDNQLNRDSAILVRTRNHSFMNLNDCKIVDRLAKIQKDEGSIDILASQFSGASWHPVSYKYGKEGYKKISAQKKRSKFIAVFNSLQLLKVKYYLPSAGPACFLDPLLMHLNYEEINIFPHQHEIKYFLKKYKSDVTVPLISPGDTFQYKKGVLTPKIKHNIATNNEEVQEHIQFLANKYAYLFAKKRIRSSNQCENIFIRLKNELNKKLKEFNPSEPFNVRLYFSLKNYKSRYISVDLNKKIISFSDKIPLNNFYHYEFPAWQIEHVLDKKISWEDMLLSFRFKIMREPDVYNTLISGFISCNAEDIKHFVETIEGTNNNERIKVVVQGVEYEIDRYCPHQGADLKYGWDNGKHWVCPKHRWNFDLSNKGHCHGSKTCINAMPSKSSLK